MIILSKLADYGVIVATHLAVGPEERQLTAGAIAAEAKLPKATVAKLLKILAHAGIVTGARGAAGGYRLARPAATVSLGEIIAAIDGAIGVTECTSHVASCVRSEFCPTRPHWHRINQAVTSALGAVTLSEMLPSFARPSRHEAAPAPERIAP
jgi:FeS assembly SUF system regulator